MAAAAATSSAAAAGAAARKKIAIDSAAAASRGDNAFSTAAMAAPAAPIASGLAAAATAAAATSTSTALPVNADIGALKDSRVGDAFAHIAIMASLARADENHETAAVSGACASADSVADCSGLSAGGDKSGAEGRVKADINAGENKSAVSAAAAAPPRCAGAGRRAGSAVAAAVLRGRVEMRLRVRDREVPGLLLAMVAGGDSARQLAQDLGIDGAAAAASVAAASLHSGARFCGNPKSEKARDLEGASAEEVSATEKLRKQLAELFVWRHPLPASASDGNVGEQHRSGKGACSNGEEGGEGCLERDAGGGWDTQAGTGAKGTKKKECARPERPPAHVQARVNSLANIIAGRCCGCAFCSYSCGEMTAAVAAATVGRAAAAWRLQAAAGTAEGRRSLLRAGAVTICTRALRDASGAAPRAEAAALLRALAAAAAEVVVRDLRDDAATAAADAATAAARLRPQSARAVGAGKGSAPEGSAPSRTYSTPGSAFAQRQDPKPHGGVISGGGAGTLVSAAAAAVGAALDGCREATATLRQLLSTLAIVATTGDAGCTIAVKAGAAAWLPRLIRRLLASASAATYTPISETDIRQPACCRPGRINDFWLLTAAAATAAAALAGCREGREALVVPGVQGAAAAVLTACVERMERSTGSQISQRLCGPLEAARGAARLMRLLLLGPPSLDLHLGGDWASAAAAGAEGLAGALCARSFLGAVLSEASASGHEDAEFARVWPKADLGFDNATKIGREGDGKQEAGTELEEEGRNQQGEVMEDDDEDAYSDWNETVEVGSRWLSLLAAAQDCLRMLLPRLPAPGRTSGAGIGNGWDSRALGGGMAGPGVAKEARHSNLRRAGALATRACSLAAAASYEPLACAALRLLAVAAADSEALSNEDGLWERHVAAVLVRQVHVALPSAAVGRLAAVTLAALKSTPEAQDPPIAQVSTAGEESTLLRYNGDQASGSEARSGAEGAAGNHGGHGISGGSEDDCADVDHLPQRRTVVPTRRGPHEDGAKAEVTASAAAVAALGDEELRAGWAILLTPGSRVLLHVPDSPIPAAAGSMERTLGGPVEARDGGAARREALRRAAEALEAGALGRVERDSKRASEELVAIEVQGMSLLAFRLRADVLRCSSAQQLD